MAPYCRQKTPSHLTLKDAGVTKKEPKPLDAEAIRRHYQAWNIPLLDEVPGLDSKWYQTKVHVHFGHVKDFEAYRTFGDILRAGGRVAHAVEKLLSQRLPEPGKRPLHYYGPVCSFLNGIIYYTSPQDERTSRKPFFGALLTSRSLNLIELFQAARCYPNPCRPDL